MDSSWLPIWQVLLRWSILSTLVLQDCPHRLLWRIMKTIWFDTTLGTLGNELESKWRPRGREDENEDWLGMKKCKNNENWNYNQTNLCLQFRPPPDLLHAPERPLFDFLRRRHFPIILIWLIWFTTAIFLRGGIITITIITFRLSRCIAAHCADISSTSAKTFPQRPRHTNRWSGRPGDDEDGDEGDDADGDDDLDSGDAQKLMRERREQVPRASSCAAFPAGRTSWLRSTWQTRIS